MKVHEFEKTFMDYEKVQEFLKFHKFEKPNRGFKKRKR